VVLFSCCPLMLVVFRSLCCYSFILFSCFFFFYCSVDPPDLHSFPTRRSSDLMAVARRLGEGDALARSGDWKGWDLDQLVGTDVWGKTLGIVGFGRIGKAMARRASGFRMKVIYTDAVRATAEAEQELRAGYRDIK